MSLVLLKRCRAEKGDAWSSGDDVKLCRHLIVLSADHVRVDDIDISFVGRVYSNHDAAGDCECTMRVHVAYAGLRNTGLSPHMRLSI
jgi:hypothetical protein